jgi:hypothetical protein
MHFIKETFELKETGGMSSFTHRFLMEVNGIIRAHVKSLGTHTHTHSLSFSLS